MNLLDAKWGIHSKKELTLDVMKITSFFGTCFGKGYKVLQTFQSPSGSQKDAENIFQTGKFETYKL